MFASSRIRLFHSSVVSPWPPGRVEHREHGLLIFCQLRLAWPGCVYELGGNYNWRGGVGAYGDAFEIEGDALAVLVSVSQIGNVELILIWYVAGPKLVVFCVTVPVVMALPAIGQAETMAAYSKMPCWFPIAWPSLPVSANGSRRCAAQAEFRPRNRSRRETEQIHRNSRRRTSFPPASAVEVETRCPLPVTLARDSGSKQLSLGRYGQQQRTRFCDQPAVEKAGAKVAG
jgi:hypothetical protein